MLRKALPPPPGATAATAFRRLPPFRESVVPWLAAAARLALGAIAKVRALSPVQPDRPPTYTIVRRRRRVERPVAPRFAGAFFHNAKSDERFFLEKERGFIELSI